MSTLLEAPSGGALKAPMEIPTLQDAAAWLTINELVPIEIEPDRACAVGLAIAVHATCALPVPLEADDTLNQSALEVANHVQAVERLNVPVAPVAATAVDDGLN